MTENRKRVCVAVRPSAQVASVKVGVRDRKAGVHVDLLPVRVVNSGDNPYTGPYEVDPLFASQTLETKNKQMSENVTVNPIYVADTSNAAGGVTIYIGGEFLG